jgi:hypothetical protein
MTDELKGSDCGLSEKPSQNLPGGNEENHENRSQSWCLGRDSKLAAPEYVPRASSLHHFVQ